MAAASATGVLKINPATQEVVVLDEGRFEEGSWKWHGGLASHDGRKIIGFPNNADSVLVVDVEAQRVYTVGDGSVLRSGSHRVPYDGRYKYLGGALTRDGRYAYLFPCDALDGRGPLRRPTRPGCGEPSLHRDSCGIS